MKAKATGWGLLTTLVIAVVTVLNLVQAVRHVRPAPVSLPGLPPPNGVLRAEARFAALRVALAKHQVSGPIGYVADLGPPEMGADFRSMEDYFSAQFVLAPCVLDPRPEGRRWAVANLRQRTAAERVPAGFRVREDCGDGVLLLEKGGP